ncbi:MAG TPA: hypothetical protein VEC09_01865 [Actinomycetota bacterium]|nr:hypothetical protein [Actinomycetota bacterium]
MATVSMVASIVFQVFLSDGVPSDRVFVHGDLDTPDMRNVVEELRQRAGPR